VSAETGSVADQGQLNGGKQRNRLETADLLHEAADLHAPKLAPRPKGISLFLVAGEVWRARHPPEAVSVVSSVSVVSQHSVE
jgi:hypothetical protein